MHQFGGLKTPFFIKVKPGVQNLPDEVLALPASQIDISVIAKSEGGGIVQGPLALAEHQL